MSNFKSHGDVALCWHCIAQFALIIPMIITVSEDSQGLLLLHNRDSRGRDFKDSVRATFKIREYHKPVVCCMGNKKLQHKKH